MTTIFDSYYPAISAGLIDLQNVHFGAYLTKGYEPKETDTKLDVLGIVLQIESFLSGSDIATLTMGEIMDRAEMNRTDEVDFDCLVTYSVDIMCFAEIIRATK